MKKRLLMIVAAMTLAVTSLAGCSSLKKDEVIVKVNDSKITADVANFYARYTQAQYESYYGAYLGDNMWNTEAEKGKTYEEAVKESVLEELERMLVFEQHMGDYGVSLSDDEKEVIKKTAKEFDENNSLENKEKIMSNTEAVERILTLMAIEEKMTTEIQKDADTEVSDEEAAQKKMDYVLFSYEKSNEDDASGETGEAEENGTMTDEEKAEIKAKAEAFAKSAKTDSEKFAELAKEEGLEVKTATFDADSQMPHEDLVKKADTLKKGEVTDVVEAEGGCYVAKVTSLKDKDATEAKKAEIVTERQNEFVSEVADKWIDKATIDVNKKAWKKIDFNELGITMKQTESDPYADEVKTDDMADQDTQEE